MLLEILQNSQKNTFVRPSFLKKLQVSRVFPVNFVKFLRPPFVTEQHPVAFVTEHQLLAYKGRVDPYIGSYQTLMRELFAKVVKHF